MDERQKQGRKDTQQIDPEIAKIQAVELKKRLTTQRARGGPAIPNPPKGKPMNDQQAIAQTVMANAQGLQQLGQNFQQFAKQTEQNIMVTQRAVQNLSRPDLILGPVVEQWHNGDHPHMILMVKEGMRIVTVGEIDSIASDNDEIVIRSDQGIISIPREYILMMYKKEEGVLYGQARRDSEIADDVARKGSEGSEDSPVETEDN